MEHELSIVGAPTITCGCGAEFVPVTVGWGKFSCPACWAEAERNAPRKLGRKIARSRAYLDGLQQTTRSAAQRAEEDHRRWVASLKF